MLGLLTKLPKPVSSGQGSYVDRANTSINSAFGTGLDGIDSTLLSEEKKKDKACRYAARAYAAELGADAADFENIQTLSRNVAYYYGWQCAGWSVKSFFVFNIVVPLVTVYVFYKLAAAKLSPLMRKSSGLSIERWEDARQCPHASVSICAKNFHSKDCFIHHGVKHCVFRHHTKNKHGVQTVQVRTRRFDTLEDVERYNKKEAEKAGAAGKLIGIVLGVVVSLTILRIMAFIVKTKVVGVGKALVGAAAQSAL